MELKHIKWGKARISEEGLSDYSLVIPHSDWGIKSKDEYLVISLFDVDYNSDGVDAYQENLNITLCDKVKWDDRDKEEGVSQDEVHEDTWNKFQEYQNVFFDLAEDIMREAYYKELREEEQERGYSMGGEDPGFNEDGQGTYLSDGVWVKNPWW